MHVPEGATPKDGPSAGVAMVTAIVSVMTGIPVRRDVAMTGEITLRGRVLPIGGLKEKLLAASRGGMKTVLIPEENAKDLVEITESIKKGLEIIPVSRMDEVLARALVRKPEPIEWDEEKAKPTETSVTTEPAVEKEFFGAHRALIGPGVRKRSTAAPQGAAVFFCSGSVLCFVLDILRTKREHGVAAGRSCASTAAFKRGSSFSLTPGPWGPGVRRNFPGEMCDETDLHCCMCGIGGTAGFVSIRGRTAEDSQAMQ